MQSHRLHRVELGCVGRELVDCQPQLGGDQLAHGAADVGVQVVPDQHERAVELVGAAARWLPRSRGADIERAVRTSDGRTLAVEDAGDPAVPRTPCTGFRLRATTAGRQPPDGKTAGGLASIAPVNWPEPAGS